MDPANWRKKAAWSLRDVAKLLGCSSASSVRRWEKGERDAPTSIALAYEQISGGKVRAEDLSRTRKRFLGVEAV